KDAMRKNYEFIEKVPTLHCRLVNRIVEGNMVIDHEEVKAGGRIMRAVAIYEIENGKIKRVYFQ
ncbi:MAG: nuclear transport factor 2 family protein, partial [Ferruginibacter sp.]